MGLGMLYNNAALGEVILFAGLAARTLFFAIFVAVMAVSYCQRTRKLTVTSIEIDRLSH